MIIPNVATASKLRSELRSLHHMYSCAHCSRNTFRVTAKLCSWAVLPAKCRECGGLCFAPQSPLGVLLVLNIVLLTLAGILASYLQSFVPLLLGAVVAAALWLLRLHVQPLVALTAEQAAAARKREGLWLLAFILLSGLQ